MNKNITPEIQNSVAGVNSILDKAEGRISELEEHLKNLCKMNVREMKRWRIQKLSETEDKVRISDIMQSEFQKNQAIIIGKKEIIIISRIRKRETMAKYFPKLLRDSQIQEAQHFLGG